MNNRDHNDEIKCSRNKNKRPNYAIKLSVIKKSEVNNIMQARKVATTSRIIYVSACRCLFLLYIFSPIKIIDIFPVVESFSPGIVSKNVGRKIIILTADNNNDGTIVGDENESSSSLSSLSLSSLSLSSSSLLSNYNDTDGASKGVVSLLTGFINANSEKETSPLTPTPTTIVSDTAPKSPEELLERIRKDYVERNYLWTGDLDIDCFFNDCVFTDPTISFVGTDKFTENTQNLVPLVEKFAENYRSELISISLGNNVNINVNNNDNDNDNDKHITTNTSTSEGNDEDGMFVESRWRMVGSLTRSPLLFWKPKIDVMYVHIMILLIPLIVCVLYVWPMLNLKSN
jgi:hypothetical protein